ncbi:prepilin-type N-terminal cleavage/methylation domain-containing protein [bacterium]|nr:MAG: prepilin-type N-terminal cleavage/methylation domain-containing protein [bacterium]
MQSPTRLRGGILKKTHRAFTLIELLVVIAIIAILAAILFPVFAQAKEAAKKTTALTQSKQVGTAINIYLGDSDDQFPCGSTPRLDNPTVVRYWNTWPALHPAGWAPDSAAQNNHSEDELVWHNSTSPYMKNNDMFISPGAVGSKTTGAPWDAWYAAAGNTPKAGNLTFNGVLQYLSTSEVAAPSVLPLLWQGMGDVYWTGRGQTSPRLVCTGTGVCRYSAGSMPQAGMALGWASQMSLYANKYGVYSGGNIYVASDSSAKVIKMSGGNTAPFPASCNNRNPIRDIDSKGNVVFPTATRGWTYSSGVAIHCAFDPSNEFNN